MIEVVNVRGLRGPGREGIIYVGREFAGWKASPLGNPFKPRPERPDALQSYREWLWMVIKDGDDQNRILNELCRIAEMARGKQEIKLGCWCHPKPCHADIIKAALEWMLKDEVPA